MLNPPITPDFAGIGFDDNSTATTISLADSFFLVTDWDTDMSNALSTSDQANNRITIGQTGKYSIVFAGHGESAAANKIFEYDVFELEGTTAITGATQADPVVITAAGHGLSNGDRVAIKDAGGMVEINDRIFTVQDVSGATFELTDDGGASPANDIDGTGFGGTIQKANQLQLVHSHRKFSAGGATDIGSFGSGRDFQVLTKDRTLELYIKDTTDATNFTFEHATLSIKREQ
jgi:hypothetical protein